MTFWRFPLSKRDSKSSVVSWGLFKGAAGDERGPGAPPTRAQVKQEPWSTARGAGTVEGVWGEQRHPGMLPVLRYLGWSGRQWCPAPRQGCLGPALGPWVGRRAPVQGGPTLGEGGTQRHDMAQRGPGTGVRQGDSWSIRSPMCSIVSWMTSHSTGQRGAGRENRACGFPGDLQSCVEGASLPWWGFCSTTLGAARAPGRAGGLQCGWGRGIPQNQGRDRERPSHHARCAGRTQCWGAVRGYRVSLTVWLMPRTSLPARAGVAHGGCLGMLPGGVPQGRGSLFPAHLLVLGKIVLQPGDTAQGQEGTPHRGQGSPRK